MMKSSLYKQLFSFQHVPSYVVVITALASYVLIWLGFMQGWPGWIVFVLIAFLWVPAVNRELHWAYRHYGWLSLYYLLTLTQVTQLVGIALLSNVSEETASLNPDMVQFVFVAWLFVGIGTLISPYRKNRWVWLTVLIVFPHIILHSRVIASLLMDGTSDFLFSLFGNTINMPDAQLHLWFNILTAVAFILGFIYQLRHTYNEWLAKAMPDLTEEELIKTTNQLETMNVKAGDVILSQGASPDKFYIITSGEFKVTRLTSDGNEEELTRRMTGEYFGEIGILSDLPRSATITAVTDGELLALDVETFRSIMNISSATEQNLKDVAKARLGQMILE